MKNFNWENFFSVENMLKLLWVFACLAILYILYRIILHYSRRFANKKMKPQNAMVLDKLVKYGFFALTAVYVLTSLGINLSAVLGAAGIAGVAIGFAAQTSFSNIISGFFIFSEHSIQAGDFITVEEITGTVQSIDLLSVKILTPDNQMVRVPNETIIKANIINTTFHLIRRMTLKVGVGYLSDLEKVTEVLLSVAKGNENVLTDPAPAVIIDSFGESSINVILAIWFKKENFLAVKNTTMKNIHRGFIENNILIPFPQIDIHFDSQKTAIPAGSSVLPSEQQSDTENTKIKKRSGKVKKGKKQENPIDQRNNVAAMEDAGGFDADEEHLNG